ncbi:hypothetical protein BZG36_01413 [Bifiguratus adelaidae]|uniref:Uncharacterized protein n=1 Tax=Bifiguratus adelaidae TaxID=1938954 RepID=A0A261Y520_9FUNG|nr:hypothetical protein BZG36_01413 [Bifiguratus adelaidae]
MRGHLPLAQHVLLDNRPSRGPLKVCLDRYMDFTRYPMERAVIADPLHNQYETEETPLYQWYTASIDKKHNQPHILHLSYQLHDFPWINEPVSQVLLTYNRLEGGSPVHCRISGPSLCCHPLAWRIRHPLNSCHVQLIWHPFWRPRLARRTRRYHNYPCLCLRTIHMWKAIRRRPAPFIKWTHFMWQPMHHVLTTLSVSMTYDTSKHVTRPKSMAQMFGVDTRGDSSILGIVDKLVAIVPDYFVVAEPFVCARKSTYMTHIVREREKRQKEGREYGNIVSVWA